MPAAQTSSQAKFAADQGGGPLQAFGGDVALCLEEAIDLRPAGVHPFGERRLRDALPFHFLGELPAQDARQCLGVRGGRKVGHGAAT